MKNLFKTLLVIVIVPLVGLGQNVFIPDANFKAILLANTAINTNGDNEIQLTEADTYNGSLYVTFDSIADLTGIESFSALEGLFCSGNQLTTLDVSQNINLTSLDCYSNQLTSLDVSQNINLLRFGCFNNQLTSLDISQNPNIYYFEAYNNPLEFLNVQNGNNVNLWSCDSDTPVLSCGLQDIPTLSCIQVDDTAWANVNWIGSIDTSFQYFSEDCSITGIQERTENKKLLKVIDLLGRESSQINQLLLYIYDDGSVEKKIVID
jgi:hypothetical protein